MKERNRKSIGQDSQNGHQNNKETNKATSSDHTILSNPDKTRIQQHSQPEKRHKEGNEAHQPLEEQVDSDTTLYHGQDATAIQNGSNTTLGPSTIINKNPTLGGKKAPFPNTAAENILLKERFLLQKIIGAGGMGVIYKAQDRLKIEARDRDPYVAIKMLNAEFSSHPEAFIALQRESRKTQRLSHPNIVKVYDFDKDADVFFMTMEYMEGKPLDQLIKQYSSTGLPWDDVWDIIRDICSALKYAHAENIIHADFKPGNIFVTTNCTAKIFDFGIARAVTNIEKTEGWPADKTLFDANSLGGLTPAYASCEMFNNNEPDVRDDIYALGCITYELFTGKHPFNKIPANIAKNKRLKPKRINKLKSRQWNALKKALSFDRKDRTKSVAEFYKQLTAKQNPWYKIAASVIIVAGSLGFTYFQNEKTTTDPTLITEHDIRSELEFSIRLDLYKQELKRLLTNPIFTIGWEDNVWKEYQGVSDLLPADDSWLAKIQNDIFSLYLNKIKAEINSSSFRHAKLLIKNAEKYNGDHESLKKEKLNLANAIRKSNEIKRLFKKEAADQLAKKNIKQEIIKQENERVTQRINEYNIALSNVNKQLKCQTNLINMRNLDVAVKKLQSLDFKKYSLIEKEIINSLATCISEQGTTFPERAIESKKYALRLFKNNSLISAIQIVSRDNCDQHIAGLGARGKRAVCRDQIKDVGNGPNLVVVPNGKNIKSFAIGKYEISVNEFNQYCSQTRKCFLPKQENNNAPITGRSIKEVKEYLKWLSKKTGKKYRLPTQDEWIYAATSKTKTHDPNRNCQLRSRGIQKGGNLAKITTGKQNSWGLVNYLGNANEWGYGKTGQLVAMGGSYINSMDECQVSSWQYHSGQPDKVTGFRVLRELTTKNNS